MTPEFKAAHTLYHTFDDSNYRDSNGDVQLSECRYHVQEGVAESYLSAVDEATQIDILISAFHKLQDESGQEAIASALFGSPLHGVKKLRELVTKEIINRIADEVERLVHEQLQQEAMEHAS